jgi:hypothetical protein
LLEFVQVLFSLILKMSDLEAEAPNEVNEKRGRKFTDIWDNMIKGEKQSKGHYSATCIHCRRHWKHGKPYILREHFANHCKKCPKDISQYYASLVGKKMGEETVEDSEEEEERPSKKPKQINISSFFEPKKLEKGKIENIDRKITKTFVMCNIPFSTVENPWFIDLIKSLQPGYDPPSRRTLSGSLLEAELARINMKINNELDKESNFTIGKNL